MRLLVDLSPAHSSSENARFHGAAEHIKSVLKTILELRHEEEVLCIKESGVVLDEELTALLASNQLTCLAYSSTADLQKTINEARADTFYTSEGYRYIDIDFGATSFVCTVHGLRSFEVFSDPTERFYTHGMTAHIARLKRTFRKTRILAQQKKNYTTLLKKAIRIIASSNHTKFFLLGEFPFLKTRANTIDVCYPPRRPSSPSLASLSETLLQKGILSKKYYLLSGAGRWIKNAYRALQALDDIYTHFPDTEMKTVVLGIEKDHPLTQTVRNTDRFVFAGFVNQEDLDALYHHAFLFIFPSLSEGFGYAPLESMAAGTPVACSAVTSITEVCGPAPLYFDPRSISEIRARILQFTMDPSTYSDHTKTSQERAQFIARKQDDDGERLVRILLGGK